MFCLFCFAEGLREGLAKSILNDEVVIINQDRYKELTAKNEQMAFDNRQIIKLAILITVILALLYTVLLALLVFIIYKFLLPNIESRLFEFLKKQQAEGLLS